MKFKVGDRVLHTAPNTASRLQGLIGTVQDLEDDVVVVNFGGAIYKCMSEVLTLSHTWRVGDPFKVKMNGGGVVHGYIASLPPAYHIMDDTNENWEWDSWEAFCRAAEPIDAPTRPSAPLACRRCREPNSYAEPNLSDGGYACYSCRKYHGYAL
jgi:hypothetical protein